MIKREVWPSTIAHRKELMDKWNKGHKMGWPEFGGAFILGMLFMLIILAVVGTIT